MLHAVIGIGSNSTRLLVARIEGGVATPILRLREDTRLFSGLSGGALTDAAMVAACDAAARLACRAREAGAQKLAILATSATREASNGEAFLALVSELCDAPARVITGDEEARLSFLGGAGFGFCGLIDLGGGSLELCFGGGRRPFCTGSAPVGARRLLHELPDLSGEGLSCALSLCEARVSALLAEILPVQMPAAFYGVGGTLTCLASMEMGLPEYDREAVEGFSLTLEAVDRWAHALSRMTLSEREQIPGTLKNRADILAHGAVALLGAMRALKIPRIVVSDKTNLDGYLREIAQSQAEADPAPIVRSFYDASVEREWERLANHMFEFEINRRYIERYVKPGDRLLDVGGGPGRYSLHMAKMGADVTLIDLSPANVDFALKKAEEAGVSLTARAGDAREVSRAAQGPFDAVLLMGPLYHLLTEADRAKALRECLSLLKPGGYLFAAFISMVGGMVYAARELPESILWENEDIFYEKVIAGEDYAGAAFTQAFLIEPRNIDPFMAKFPLKKLHLLSSEGITAPFHRNLADCTPEARAKWLAVSLALCEREEFFAYAEHLLYVGQKKEE